MEASYPIQEMQLETTSFMHSRYLGGLFDPISPPWTASALHNLLVKHSVDVTLWEEYKVGTLAAELEEGKALLFLSEAGTLWHTLDLVSVVVEHPSLRQVIVEFSGKHCAPDKSRSWAVRKIKK